MRERSSVIDGKGRMKKEIVNIEIVEKMNVKQRVRDEGEK